MEFQKRNLVHVIILTRNYYGGGGVLSLTCHQQLGPADGTSVYSLIQKTANYMYNGLLKDLKTENIYSQQSAEGLIKDQFRSSFTKRDNGMLIIGLR